MPYNDKVVDHFNNPRNVGTLNKEDADVGTGIVGAPACFPGDTLIATADGSGFKPIKDIFDSNSPCLVWSFSLKEKVFQIKKAQAIFSGKKAVDQITFNDGSNLKVTPDHQFLLRPFYLYQANSQLTSDDSIRPFRKYVSKRGYWRLRDTLKQYEYLELFHYYNSDYKLSDSNVHHKDHNKRNDNYKNLEAITIADHLSEHRTHHWKKFTPKFSENEIRLALENSYARPETADLLGIFTDEFYKHLKFYGIGVKKSKSKEELNSIISARMIVNNPYFNFTAEQKFKFASHPGDSNGRWVDVSNEYLLWCGNLLYKSFGKITAKEWCKFAKRFNLPQNLSSRFQTWNSFKEQVINFNHTITNRTNLLEEIDCYTMQVEENNNYVVVTKYSKNIIEGIVVKNCGDVMRLQIKVEDNIIKEAKFKTFGCGSAIASSSLATEWIKDKTLEEAESIKNVQIVEELSLPPVKIHCSILAEDAIKAAIKDYREKNK